MDLEQQLRAALAPCRPAPQLRAAILARVATHPARGARRPGGRIIVSGTLVAVAAAASMLAIRLAKEPAPQVVVAPSGIMSTPLGPVEATPPENTATAPVPAEPQVVQDRSEPASPVRTVTVRVQPLQNTSTNSAARQAVEIFYATLVEGLRATPGITLLTPDSTGFAQDAPVDYKLTLRGSEMLPDNFTVRMDFHAVARKFVLPVQLGGDIAPPCAGMGSADCGDPASMAGRGLQLLRANIFLSASRVSPELRMRFLDTALAPADRMAALREMTPIPTVASDRAGAAKVLVWSDDPEIVRGLADLAATAADPRIRAAAWVHARSMGVRDLIPAMTIALRLDRDEQVRLQVATTLAQEFPRDPEARAALEGAEKEDPYHMVRAVARRGLQGEEAWTEYVATAVKDTGLAPVERLRPLLHTMNQRMKPYDLSRVLTDGEAIQAFVDAFRQAQASAEGRELPLMQVLGGLDSVYHPAITGMLLETLERAVEPSMRQSIVSQLIRRNADERVQALLRKLSVEDSDPEMRELAAKGVRPAPATTSR